VQIASKIDAVSTGPVNANIVSVAGIEVDGVGTEETPWGPA
jgi:hypothetical protein